MWHRNSCAFALLFALDFEFVKADFLCFIQAERTPCSLTVDYQHLIDLRVSTASQPKGPLLKRSSSWRQPDRIRKEGILAGQNSNYRKVMV